MQAFAESLFAVPTSPDGLPVSAVQTEWFIPVVLVDFTDQPAVTPPDYFTQMIFDTTGADPTGSVFDYYVWASGNRIHVRGEVVGWYHLPQTKNYYANDAWGVDVLATPHNAFGCAYTAAGMADSAVDFSRFDLDHDGYVDMFWLVHSGYGGEATANRQNLWSFTSQMNARWRNGGSYRTNDLIPGTNINVRIDRFSILPEFSSVHAGMPSEKGVYCHEFGHALGLPDLYDARTLGGGAFCGPGNWSLMATGGWGGDGRTPDYPTHPGAWPSLFLGWTTSFRPAADTLVSLPPLVTGGPVLELWPQGESYTEHFLVENREAVGFDRSLPGSGLIVYHINEVVIGSGLAANQVNPREFPGLLLVEADGRYDMLTGFNRGEASDAFPGSLDRTLFNDVTIPNSHAFNGGVTNVSLRDIRPDGQNIRFVAQVQPVGWAASRRWSGASYSPTLPYGSGRTAAMQDDGTIDVVWVDQRASPARVYARRKWMGAVWDAEQPVSLGVTAASDAAVAAAGDGDLAVVWADSRFGARQIYVRTFIDGAWGAEQRVSQSAAEAHAPAVTMDRQHGVIVAWIEDKGDSGRVMVSAFPAGTDPGAPFTLTRSQPQAPSLAVDPDGNPYIAWADYIGQDYASVYLMRMLPDLGWTMPTRVSASSGYDASSVSLACDAVHGVHVAWQQVRPGRTEVHYHHRIVTPTSDVVALSDSVVEDRSDYIQNPSIAAGRLGDVHVVFEMLKSGTFEVRYKRFDPQLGWDFSSTEVTKPPDGTSLRPIALPSANGRLTLLWQLYRGAGDVVGMERIRDIGGAPVLSVDAGPARRSSLRLGPNPLRAGLALTLIANDPAASGEVEVLDLAGRHVASATLEHGQARFDGRLTQVWRSGIFYARMRGSRGPGAAFVVLR